MPRSGARGPPAAPSDADRARGTETRGFALRGSGVWRLWVPVTAIVVGALTGGQGRAASGCGWRWDPGAYPKMDGFLARLGARRRWSEEMIERIRGGGEEALLFDEAAGLARWDDHRHGPTRDRGAAGVVESRVSIRETPTPELVGVFSREQG